MPDVLKDKSYYSYDRLSRYQNIPFYFNTEDKKYVYGTTKYLRVDTSYASYQVQKNDSWDSIALNNYNNPTLYWIILNFNRIQDPFQEPKEGTIIKIPVITNIKYED